MLGSIKNVNGATADTKVGIGIAAPTLQTSRHRFRAHAACGLKRTPLAGTVAASFGGFGEFQIDAVNVVGGRFPR